MKLVVRILIPIITLSLCVWGDIAFVGFLFSKLPFDLSWLFWAKFGIILGIIWLTAGIIVFLVLLSNLITECFLED